MPAAEDLVGVIGGLIVVSRSIDARSIHMRPPISHPTWTGFGGKKPSGASTVRVTTRAAGTELEAAENGLPVAPVGGTSTRALKRSSGGT